MNQPPQRLPFLDGLRGVAILLVFFHHALYDAYRVIGLPWNGWFPGPAQDPSYYLFHPFSWGLGGVALFFVISGFCIHTSYATSTDKSWSGFFHRRFFRIYPPYVAALCLFLIARPLLTPAYNTPRQLDDVAIHLSLLQNLSSVTFFGYNPSFWSIATEAQLYLLYPLLFLVAHRFGWATSMTIAAVGEIAIRLGWTVWRLAAVGESWPAALPLGLAPTPLAYWFSWSIGAHMAECWLQRRATAFSRLPLTPFVVATLATTLFRPLAEFNFLGYALISAVVIDRFLTGRWRAPSVGIPAQLWRHLGLLGVVSYSFYLLHQPIGWTGVNRLSMWLAPEGAHPMLRMAFTVALYPAILALSYAAYRWVELPSVRLGAALRRKREQPPMRESEQEPKRLAA